MTIREQVKLVGTALEAWSKANRGRVFVASDTIDCLEQLRARPGTPTCAILWNGRDTVGDMDRLGKKANTFKVVVSRGRSLRIVAGESLTEGAAGGEPMFDLVEQAEAVVLGVRQEVGEDDDPEDAIPVHEGTGPFEVNGMLLDAMEIRFSLVSQAEVQFTDDEV